MPGTTKAFQELDGALLNIANLLDQQKPHLRDLNTAVRRLDRAAAALEAAIDPANGRPPASSALRELLDIVAETRGLFGPTLEHAFGSHPLTDKPVIPKNKLTAMARQLKLALDLARRHA